MSMTDAINIRRATADDAPFIIESNVTMALETEGLALDEERVRPGVAAVLSDSSLGFYLVAEVEGQWAGQLMVTFEWSDWRNGLFWWIQSVYVRPQFRRRGIYRALHRKVAALAQEAGGVCGLRLYVDKDNVTAQKVYESLDMHCTRYYLYEVEF